MVYDVGCMLYILYSDMVGVNRKVKKLKEFKALSFSFTMMPENILSELDRT